MLIHVTYSSVLQNSYLNCKPVKSRFIYETNSDFKQERILTQTDECNLFFLRKVWLKVNRIKQIGMYI